MNSNNLNTLEDFQKFIDNNKIKSLREFRLSYKTIYSKYLKIRKVWKNKELSFEEISIVDTYKDLNTVEDFQKFVDDNNILTKTDLRKKYGSVSSRFFKVIKKEDRGKLKFKIELHHYHDDLNTVDDFKKFINSNGILSPKEFKNKFPKEYDRFCRVIPKEDKQKVTYKVIRRSYHDIISINDLQIFINDNNIRSKKELHKKFSGLYVKFLPELNSITFIKNNKSIGEKQIEDLLIINGINFEEQKVYSNLKDKNFLRFDFYLPDFNLIIEHHGEGHFGKGRYFSDELIKHDKMKYDYAINNNISIIYYTIYKKDYEKYGYFTEVLTDVNTLLERIKEIGMTNQSNIN